MSAEVATAEVSTAHSGPPVSLGSAVLQILVGVAAITGFVWLCSALGLVSLYAGFLLVWYWATVDKLDFKLAPATIVGAIGGAATAWAYQLATQAGSRAGMIAVLLVVLVAAFLQTMQYLPFLFNASYMLFLTVGFAPLIQGGEQFQKFSLTILISAIYFGGLIFIGTRLAAANAARRAPG